MLVEKISEIIDQDNEDASVPVGHGAPAIALSEHPATVVSLGSFSPVPALPVDPASDEVMDGPVGKRSFWFRHGLCDLASAIDHKPRDRIERAVL